MIPGLDSHWTSFPSVEDTEVKRFGVCTADSDVSELQDNDKKGTILGTGYPYVKLPRNQYATTVEDVTDGSDIMSMMASVS